MNTEYQATHSVTEEPHSGVIDKDGRNIRAHAIIERDPETGFRRIVIDGNVFPFYTRGPISVNTLRSDGYRRGGFWPADPDDEFVKGGGHIYGHEVTLTLVIGGGVEWDAEALKGRLTGE